MNGFLAVAAGGAIGAAMRHGVSVSMAAAKLGNGAHATLVVNVLGGALMGVMLGYLMAKDLPGENAWWLFLGTGVLGGFTTFSAFSREKVYMIQQGEIMKAVAYAGVSVLGALIALMAALYLSRKMFS